jgi:hypothetical protein
MVLTGDEVKIGSLVLGEGGGDPPGGKALTYLREWFVESGSHDTLGPGARD